MVHAASRSAAIIAAHRAMESAKPRGERICYDPLAEKFIGPDVTVIGSSQMPKSQALTLFKQFVPGFHEYFLARTRFIDDYLSACIDHGLEQLAILGAGYDSRAYRFEALKKNVAVFEIDHPATQTVKKKKLKQIFGKLPSHVTYVPADLQNRDFASSLLATGYNQNLKTLFIWEGVTMYLDAGSVDQVLLFVSQNSGTGSSIIFDFTSPQVVQGREKRTEALAWRQKTTDVGEPLKFGIAPGDLDSFLKQRHFSRIASVTHDDLKKAYFNHPEDKRLPTPILTIAHATIDG